MRPMGTAYTTAYALAALAAMRDVPSRPPEPIDTKPVQPRGPRAGRNQPCPCGSGKKFKRCCREGVT